MVGAPILERTSWKDRTWQSESRMFEVKVMKSSRYDRDRLAEVK